MTVRERIERRSEFASDRFVVIDPELGHVNANVSDFIGVLRDGKSSGIRYDHPAIGFEVLEQ